MIFPDIPTRIRHYGSDTLCRYYEPAGLSIVEDVWNENKTMGREHGIKRQIVGNSLIEVVCSHGLSFCNITAPYPVEELDGPVTRCMCGCHVAQGLILAIFLKDGTEIFGISDSSDLYDVSYLDTDTYYTVAVCQNKTDYIVFNGVRRVDLAAYQRGERITVLWQPASNDERTAKAGQDIMCELSNGKCILIPIDPVLSNYQV